MLYCRENVHFIKKKSDQVFGKPVAPRFSNAAAKENGIARATCDKFLTDTHIS